MGKPRLYRTRAIILRRRDFDESDRLLTVLTPDHGKQTLLAKGARKISSRKAPHVDLFKQADLLVHEGRNFGVVSQAETVRSFAGVCSDLPRLAAAHYLAELADSFLGEDDEARAAYDLTLEVLGWLDEGGDPQLAQRYYELHLLDIEGYRPQLYRCLGCDEWLEPAANVFDVAAGGMFCPKCAAQARQGRSVSIGAQKVLRFLQRSTMGSCRGLVLGQPVQDEIEALLGAYIQRILDHQPRSHRFVEAVRALPPLDPAPAPFGGVA
jgi:DNA repair protein RecO (recombination protein O)